MKDKKSMVVAYRRRMKLRAVEYKGGKCAVCGYDRSVRAMTFHHLDPDTKDFKIGSGNSWKWDVIKPGLDKCVFELSCGGTR